MSLFKSAFTIALNTLFISTCLAGIESRTGERIKTNLIKNDTARRALDATLNFGDTILIETGKLMSQYPDYFESNNKLNIKFYF